MKKWANFTREIFEASRALAFLPPFNLFPILRQLATEGTGGRASTPCTSGRIFSEFLRVTIEYSHRDKLFQSIEEKCSLIPSLFCTLLICCEREFSSSPYFTVSSVALFVFTVGRTNRRPLLCRGV